MIHAKGKDIAIIHAGGKLIAYVYKGTRIVWEAIRSCFGSGRWINEKPWLNGEGWRNK